MNEARGGSKSLGRDHHPHCYTMWFAGGGVRAGTTFGETDEFGYFIPRVEDKVAVRDVQATIGEGGVRLAPAGGLAGMSAGKHADVVARASEVLGESSRQVLGGRLVPRSRRRGRACARGGGGRRQLLLGEQGQRARGGGAEVRARVA